MCALEAAPRKPPATTCPAITRRNSPCTLGARAGTLLVIPIGVLPYLVLAAAIAAGVVSSSTSRATSLDASAGPLAAANHALAAAPSTTLRVATHTKLVRVDVARHRAVDDNGAELRLVAVDSEAARGHALFASRLAAKMGLGVVPHVEERVEWPSSMPGARAATDAWLVERPATREHAQAASLDALAFHFIADGTRVGALDKSTAFRTFHASYRFSRALYAALSALDEPAIVALCSDPQNNHPLLTTRERAAVLERRGLLLGAMLERIGEQGEGVTLR